MRRLASFIVLALAALLLACGGGDTPTSEPSPTETVEEPTPEVRAEILLSNGTSSVATFTLGGIEDHTVTLEACSSCPVVGLSPVVGFDFSLPDPAALAQACGEQGQQQLLSVPLGDYELIATVADGGNFDWELSLSDASTAPRVCVYESDDGFRLDCANCPQPEAQPTRAFAPTAVSTPSCTPTGANEFAGTTSEGGCVTFELDASGDISSFQIDIMVRCSLGFGEPEVTLQSGAETFHSSAALSDPETPIMGVVSINQLVGISPDGSFRLGNLAGTIESGDAASGAYQFTFTGELALISCSSELIQWTATR